MFLVVLAMGAYGRWLLTLDPFARYRAPGPGSLGGDIGIRLQDVSVRSYKKGRLLNEFFVKQADVRKDRRNFTVYGVSNGIYYAADGPMHFECASGVYDSGYRKFSGRDGAHVWNADLNLKLDNFDYQEHDKRLVVPGKVRGQMYGGDVVADRLEYYADSGVAETGPIEWTGIANLPSQEAKEARNVQWTVKGAHMKRVGDVSEYTDGHATDGEVIVTAPTVKFNHKTDVVEATGRVHYFGVDANLICDSATVYRKEKRAVLTGNITMLIKAEEGQKLEEVEIAPYTPTVPDEIAKNRPAAPNKPTDEQKKQDDEVRSTKNFRTFPAIIHADKIEYWYAKGNKHAIVTGACEAFQSLPNGGWRRGWAPKALYDGEKETLKMVSTEGKKDTRFQTSVGDDLIWDWVQISTKKGEEDNYEGANPEGNVIGYEDEARPNKSGTKPPPDKKPPPLQGPIGSGRSGGRGRI